MTAAVSGKCTSNKLVLSQVLADQAVWAVCGRAAGVVNMAGTTEARGDARQNRRVVTVDVEVMPLVGGHLLLPKVNTKNILHELPEICKKKRSLYC